MDRETKGCLAIIAGIAALYLLWKTVIYLGIPLAIAGAGFSIYQIRKLAGGTGEHDESDRQFFMLGLGASVALAAISIAANIYADDGYLGRQRAAEQVAQETQDEQQREATLKASVTPSECAYLKNFQSHEVIKDYCYKQSPAEGFRGAMGRAECQASYSQKLKACGLEELY